MRLVSSVTSISWIPSEGISGPMRLPLDIGIGHYDSPPPERVVPGELDRMRDDDRFRFANHLAAWVEVEAGRIVDAGYSGSGLVGSTTAQLGMCVTFPGVGFPLLQQPPSIEPTRARFVQTAGGRTGLPFPRRIDRPPYVRLTAPTAWTTLALEIDADGSTDLEVVGASPFPRHWVYGPDGSLALKSGVMDFAEWTRFHDHDRSPWHDVDRSAMITAAETQFERELSRMAMAAAKPTISNHDAGSRLTMQGQAASGIYLVLDGVLLVDVDGDPVAEVGPGAIIGERALLETGRATATVTAITPVRVADLPVGAFDRSELQRVATGHRCEETRP